MKGDKHTDPAENEWNKICGSVWNHKDKVDKSCYGEDGHESIASWEGRIVRIEFNPGRRAVDSGVEGKVHCCIKCDIQGLIMEDLQ